MKRIAVFPGSFDPVSSGHVDIVMKAARLFDTVYVAVGVNSNKSVMFELARRVRWLEIATHGIENVEVSTYSGLTIDYCNSVDAGFIIRGVRNSVDLEYERSIADTNAKLAPNIQTVFLPSDSSQTSVQSSILRELIRNNADVSMFLPSGVNVYE